MPASNPDRSTLVDATGGKTCLSQFPMSPADAIAALMQPNTLHTEAVRALEREVAALRALVEKRGEDDRWLNSTEAGEYLGMSKNTFEAYRSSKERNRLPGHRVGGKILFKKSALDTWVKLWEAHEQGRV